jgi:hypothetical protein
MEGKRWSLKSGRFERRKLQREISTSEYFYDYSVNNILIQAFICLN